MRYVVSPPGGGDPRAFTFSVASGAWPPGLRMTADGVVHGRPTVAGSFTFTVQAKVAATPTTTTTTVAAAAK